MTGLADAYNDDVGGLQSPIRLRAGVGLLAVGTFLGMAALLAVVANPTDMHTRRVAGLLGGLAAPSLVGGVVVILPASPRLRAAAAIGASVTLLGVASFWQAYPEHWAGYGRDLTAYVTAVYFLGMLTIVCCCFAGIATLKRRNDPGGTVSLQVGEGETKYVKVREQVGGIGGGVGLLGGTPDETVETQTNRPDRSASGSSGGRSSETSGRSGAGSSATSSRTTGSGDGSSGFGSGPTTAVGGPSASADGPSASTSGSSPSRGAVSDGGAQADSVQSVEPGERDPSASGGANRDRYCGNCEHFQYVRTEQGMTPYCGLTAEYMEDMEACDDWSPNA